MVERLRIASYPCKICLVPQSHSIGILQARRRKCPHKGVQTVARERSTIGALLIPVSSPAKARHHLSNKQLHVSGVREPLEFDLEQVKAEFGELLNALSDC